MLRLTVAICTWNRAALLDQTLTRLRALHVPAGSSWEVLVVNNNCTDGTDAVLAAHAVHLPLRCLAEPQPGKAHAANRAAAEAAGDLVLWTDDDVLVDPNWLAAYAAAAQRWPHAAVFGGPVRPWFPAAPPAWVRRNLPLFRDVFALLGEGIPAIEQPLQPPWHPFGANMAVRTAVQRAFPYNTRMGPQPGSEVRNEDAELMERLRAAGHGLVWVPDACVDHWVPLHRMTIRYIREWKRGEGRSEILWRGVPEGPRWRGVPRWLWRRFIEERVRAARLRLSGRTTAWLLAFMQAQSTFGVIQQCRDAARTR